MTSRRRVGPLLGKTASGILWSARALGDLNDIGNFISRDNPEAARRWLSKLIKAAERSERFPYSGRIVPEIGRPEIREILVRSYRIVYRVRPERIEVLTVFEGHRRLAASDLSDDSRQRESAERLERRREVAEDLRGPGDPVAAEQVLLFRHGQDDLGHVVDV